MKIYFYRRRCFEIDLKGTPMKKQFTISIIIILLCIGELSGCFEQNKKNNTTNTEDTQGPTIPSNVRCTTPQIDNMPAFSWSASIDTSGVAGYYVKIDLSIDTWVGNILSWKSISAIADGTHTFYVKAMDGSIKGNNGSYGSCSFIINTLTGEKPPVADANGPYAGFINHSITFNGSKSEDIDGSIVNYTWNLDNGTILYGKIVTHSFYRSGLYNITLTVTDNDGLTNTSSTIADIIFYADDGGNTNGSSTEQEKFIGSWHNIDVKGELWIFYGNGTRKTILHEIDDMTQQPYFYTVWSFYKVANMKICFSDLDAPSEEPSICYDYTFSESNTILSVSFDGVVVFSLERE